MLLKFCAACTTLRSSHEFHRNRAHPDGLCTHCASCDAERRTRGGIAAGWRT